MGSFAISTTSTNDITGRIEWSESNVSIANNTSDLNVKLIYRMNASQYATLGSGYFKITVNGTAYEDNHYVTFASGTHEYTVIDHTFTITHDANGAKSVSIVLNNGYVAGSSGLSASSGSGTATLTTIARASQPSCPSSTVFGTSVTVNTNRVSSDFVHDITYTVGSHSASTGIGITNSFSWVVPASWADVIPTSTSTTLTITCKTYSGSTLIGTKTCTSTISIPDSWKPSASISKTLTNGGDSGQVIANVTTVNLSASATASTGTSISSYSWSGGAVSGTGASKSHSPSSTGNYTYTVTVTDRRGRTGTATVSATSVSGASSFSCAWSVNFGSALSVSISRIKSSFTHSVAYTINSSYTNTLTGQGTSASYTIPTSWAASVPAASSINMTVTVTTYNGSSSLGSTSKTVSVVVPSSWVPAFTLTATAVSAFNSQYLKGVSKVTLAVSSAAASTGSSIQSYQFTGNNVNKSATTTATSYSVTSDLLTVVGTNTYTVKVTDKRGRVTTKTTSITVVNYAPPTIKLSVGRYNSGGTADNFGGYGRMVATGSWVAVSGNSWTLTLKQKKKTASSYTTVNTWSSQTTSAVSKTSDLFSADVDSAYDCQATITDAVGKTATVTVALSTGKALMDWFKDKVVGIFSTASETIRQTLGNPTSLLYSNASKTYFNGEVYVPSYGSSDGLTDGWRKLNESFLHQATGTGGQSGYIHIATLTISGTWMNAPIELVFARRRDFVHTRLWIKFTNVDSTDPDIQTIYADGECSDVYLYKQSTSTWNLYILKSEPYDNISITQLHRPSHVSGIKVVWANNQASSVPSGSVQATRAKHYGPIESSDGGFRGQYIEFVNLGTSDGHGGFIDFHFNNSSSDYTARIIESPSGRVNVNSPSGPEALYVSGYPVWNSGNSLSVPTIAQTDTSCGAAATTTLGSYTISDAGYYLIVADCVLTAANSNWMHLIINIQNSSGTSLVWRAVRWQGTSAGGGGSISVIGNLQPTNKILIQLYNSASSAVTAAWRQSHIRLRRI